MRSTCFYPSVHNGHHHSTLVTLVTLVHSSHSSAYSWFLANRTIGCALAHWVICLSSVLLVIEAKLEVWRWPKKSTFWRWFPVSYFRQVLAKRTVLHNTKCHRWQTDDRQTDWGHTVSKVQPIVRSAKNFRKQTNKHQIRSKAINNDKYCVR